MPAYNVLILGASYGSLLATKLLFGGHKITMVCLPAEIEAFNGEGAIVRLPIRGRREPVELNSQKLPGSLKAAGPAAVNPADFDLVALAMQEPQYRSPGVRELLDAVAKAKKPCMSIMNMPPLPYLKRIPGLNTEALKSCFTDAAVWDNFEPGLVTLCSPDPQAIRPPGEKINVLQVTLPTNFKVARFDSEPYTAMLRQMEKDVDAARWNPGDGAIELPVKLRVHNSIFVPLAKWAMLLTGNYRCVKPDRAVDIKDAVHADMAASRDVYNWVRDLCVRLGAAPEDLVPFEKYATAANDLVRPSSAARALFNGAQNIERTDRLVQAIAAQMGLKNPLVDQTVATVDARLARQPQSRRLTLALVSEGDFSQRLLSGERVIWSGRPGQGVRLSGRDAMLIPFSLMFGGFAVFWEASVLRMPTAPAFFRLWGVPFVLIGAYLVVGRFIVDAWVRSSTWYALTNRQILIDRSGLFNKFTALNLDRLPDVQLREHATGRGTILFGQPLPYWGQGAGWWYGTPALDPTPQFIAIADARTVFDQIQRAIRSAA